MPILYPYTDESPEDRQDNGPTALDKAKAEIARLRRLIPDNYYIMPAAFMENDYLGKVQAKECEVYLGNLAVKSIYQDPIFISAFRVATERGDFLVTSDTPILVYPCLD